MFEKLKDFLGMTDKKGQHIFKLGDMVFPHPILYLQWKEISEDEVGIVTEIINPVHPTKDERKVRVFWQQKQVEGVYAARRLFHTHQTEQIEVVARKWKYPYPVKPGDVFGEDEKTFEHHNPYHNWDKRGYLKGGGYSGPA